MTSSRQSLFVGQSVSFSSAGYSSQLSHAILKAISCLTQFLRQQAFLQSSLFFLNPACVALILTSALAAFCFWLGSGYLLLCKWLHFLWSGGRG
jgi:hypothetical protein